MQTREKVLVITLLWLLITALNFYTVHEIAQKEGAPLESAEPRLLEKVALTLQAPMLRQVGPNLERMLDAKKLTKPYGDIVDKSPDDIRLRCHYAIMLAATGQREDAFHQLDVALRISRHRKSELCMALRDVLHPPVTARSAKQGASLPWPESAVSRFEKILKGALEGWQLDFALKELYDDGLQNDKAQARQNALEQAANRTLLGFVAIGAALLMNFCLGMCVLIVFLAAGRNWNLRTVEASAEDGVDESGPRFRQHGATWDPVAGWAMVVVFPLAIHAVGSVARSLVHDPSTMGPSFLVGVQAAAYVLILAVAGSAIRFQWATVGVHLQHWVRSVLVGICVFWGGLLIVYSIALFVSRLGAEPSQNPVFLKLSETSGVSQWLIMWSLVGLMGPIFEEILFRGIIYTSMRCAMRPLWAIPLNGLVFSAVHGDPNSFVPLAILGMLLAWTFERTRSVVASSVTHCLWNTQTFVLAALLFS